MKKRKLVSAVLVVSMLLPLAGCNSDNKGVMEAADKYAQAIISMDSDDIADLMDDDDGIDDVFAPYEACIKRNEKTEDVFEAIAGSITYVIDKKSVKSNTKDKEASCDIIFTLVDYDDIYDEVKDDDGDIDDYIDALEDAEEDQTIEITLSVEFVLQRDKWVVKDKKLKNLTKIYKFFSDVSEYGFCSFEALSLSEYKAAIYDAFDADEWDCYEYDGYGYEEIDYYGYDVYVYVYIYDDVDDAQWEFEDYYDYYSDWFEDGYASGDYVYEYDGTSGYFLMDDCDYDGYYTMYGGIYLTDNVFILAMSYEGQDSDLDYFLNTCGLPLP